MDKTIHKIIKLSENSEFVYTDLDAISVCSECDKHTDDDSPYNNTKWDNYGDPYCQDCFNKIESEVE